MRTDTPKSLLDRLRSDNTAADWEVFCGIYRPLLQRQLSRNALSPSDSDDIVQDVLARVFVALPSFAHNGREGAFRNWLGKIVVQQLSQYFKNRTPKNGIRQLDGVAAIEPSVEAELESIWQTEHDQHVLKKLLELIQPEFTETTWRAFVSVAIEGRSVSETGLELDMSPNAVMIAKSRILARLRNLGRDLIGDL